jgi:ribosomal protein S12 methylthiotransferase
MQGLKAGIVSLGCAKNLVDTEVMLGILSQEGIEITNNPAEAEIIIVNTCSFINTAKEESINTILQMGQYKEHGICKALIVTGCLSQRYKDELLEELPEVDVLLGTGEWNRIAEAIRMAFAGERAAFVGNTERIYDESQPRIATTPQYSVYVKIAEGCNNCCSYCVIPSVRGKFRSRSIESVVAEVKGLAGKGVKEINLIAQDTTSYGRDLYGAPHLVELLQALIPIEGIQWIRLLYCYPTYFTDELIEIIATEPKICKYVDIPLQHADDSILRTMHRRSTQQEVIDLIDKIRNRIPEVAVRTSFIVGFPGEDEQHFQNLFEFVEKTRFDRIGVFMYSQEEGTPAAELENQVPEDVKENRYHRLMELQTQISQELNERLVGKFFTVLIEGQSEDQPDILYGRTERDAPDIDGKVYITRREGIKAGDMVSVEITDGYAYDLSGEVTDD